jgi:lipopolysaccharide heptosyltransferase I
LTRPAFSRPERILLVRLGALGDVVHAIPVAAALRRAWPSVRLDWVVDARHRPVLDLVDGLDEVVCWRGPSVAGVEGLAAVVRRLRRASYDVALDLQGLLKSALVARASGARRVIGFGPAQLREPAARWFYTDTVEAESAGHVVEKNLSMLTPFGIASEPPRFPFRVNAGEKVSDVRDRARRSSSHRDFAILSPGAAWPNKRWPPERFGRLAVAIHRRFGWASCVLWGPGEAALADAVVAASETHAFAAPSTQLEDVLALAREARLFVSGDTGPMHLAAAVGTPVVGLFGPTSPTRNGPWGAATDSQVSRFKECACHYQRRCSRGARCLDEIHADEIVEAADVAIAHRADSGAGPS